MSSDYVVPNYHRSEAFTSLDFQIWSDIKSRQLDYLAAFKDCGYTNVTVYNSSIVGWRSEGKKRLELKISVEKNLVRVEQCFVLQKSEGQKSKSRVLYCKHADLDATLDQLLTMPVSHTSLDISLDTCLA